MKEDVPTFNHNLMTVFLFLMLLWLKIQKNPLMEPHSMRIALLLKTSKQQNWIGWKMTFLYTRHETDICLKMLPLI